MLPDGPGGKRIAADFLFRSKDLATWEYLHPFTEDDRFTLVGDDGACPYFWPIGDRWILPFFSHMSGGQYLLGDYDMERGQVRRDERRAVQLWCIDPVRRSRTVGDARRRGRRDHHPQHEPRPPFRGLEPDHVAAPVG